MSPVNSLIVKTRRVAAAGKSSPPKSHCDVTCLGISAVQRFGNAPDLQRAARLRININQSSLQENSTGGDPELLGGIGEEPLDDRLDFAAQDAFVGAGKAGVCQISGAAGKNLFVRRLDMGMGADDRADLAIEHSGQSNFL